MAKVVHIIDPNPDTVIILTNPLVHFADWEKPVVIEDSGLEARNVFTKKEKRKRRKREMKPVIWDRDEPTQSNGVTEKVILNPLPSVGEPSLSKEPISIFGNGTLDNTRLFYRSCHSAHFGTTSTLAPEPAVEVEPPVEVEPAVEAKQEPIEDPTNEEGIQYHVSSRHLILASKKFRTMMTGEKWKEGVRDADGLYYTRPDGWDADAFLILMNIFHLRNRSVPRSVSLELLAKIAVLVDFYECEEAVEVFTELWIQHLRDNSAIPDSYNRDLMLWICVAQVFDLDQEFKQSTDVALKQSTETIRTLDLPIWPTIVDEIDLRRYQAMEDVVSKLHDKLDEYHSSNYSCPQNSSYSFLCGSFMLGALTKEMDSISLFSPRPEIPFYGLSFGKICEQVRKFNSPAWHHSNSSGYSSYKHPCNLTNTVSSIVDDVVRGIEGLDLKTFTGRKRQWRAMDDAKEGRSGN